MPDNEPAPEDRPKPAPPPASPQKKGSGGKIVVMLSSVAKAAPGSAPPPASVPADTSLNPGSGLPGSATLTGPIIQPPVAKAKPPPLPAKLAQPAARAPDGAWNDSKFPGHKRTGPIKLNLPKTSAPSSGESIFLDEDKSEAPAESHPVGWKELEPGELLSLKGDLQSLEVFSRSGPPSDNKSSASPVPPPVEEKLPVAESKSTESKAPEALSRAPVKPLVNLPPVAAAPPPTTIAPAVILSSPAPVAPALAPIESLPMPVGLTAPIINPLKPAEKPAEDASAPVLPILPPPTEKVVAPAGDQTLPATLTSVQPAAELPPVVEVKPPAPVEPPTPITAPPPLKTEPPVVIETKLPSKVDLDPVPLAPPLLKTDAPTGRKLPPPLPARPVVKPSDLPLKSAPSAEAKAEPEKKPETPLPAKQPKPALSGSLPGGAKIEPKPAGVTGPILVRDTRPALRPPVLPDRMAREKQREKSAAPVEPLAESPIVVETKPSDSDKPKAPVAPAEKPVEAPLVVVPPLIVEAKTSDSDKLKAPVVPAEKPSEAPVTVVPPLIVEAKTSEPDKLKAPVAHSEKPSEAPVAVVPPLIVETKPAEADKLKAPLKPEEKPVAAKIVPAAQPGKPAVPEQPKPSRRPDPRSQLAAAKAPVAAPVGKKASPDKAAVAPAAKKASPDKAAVAPAAKKALPDKPAAAPADPASTPRAARARKKRFVSNVCFYTLCVVLPFALYYIGGYFCRETRLEGQVIPPEGMLLGDEAWIVTDFRDEAAREADDLADKRAPALQDIQRDLNHVQRAQADIAAREERVRLLEGQIQAAKDEITSVVKQAKDAAQQLWDGPGAQIDQDYDARQQQLSEAIADRAKALKLTYQPDPNFNSPEVWANAYRLALYQVPPGVDSAKELVWLDDEMKQWRDFTKSVDDRKEKVREQVAAVKQSPASRVTDLQAQIDDLQRRIESTSSEEMPIKTELQQAQSDLAQSQATESALDESFYQQLYSIPESRISTRLPMQPNGRFSWRTIDKDSPFSEGETSHSMWLFARAVRPDGRQYWALNRITVDKDSTLEVVIEPEAFVSTKAILRPDLSPDEQDQ